MAWGRGRWKSSQPLFYLLVFFSDRVDKYLGTVFKGERTDPKAAEWSTAPGKDEGGSNVANLVRCQGVRMYVVSRHVYHTGYLPPGRLSHCVNNTLGLHFSVTAQSFDHDYQHLNEWIEAEGGCSADRQVGGRVEGSI